MSHDAIQMHDSGSEPRLYMAMELGTKNWKLGFSDAPAANPRIRNVSARSPKLLEKEIGLAKKRFGLSADAPVVACQEAGRDGFSVHRLLERLGVDSIVVDPSSIEVPKRYRRKKTDKIDVVKLLSMLIRHCSGEKKVWSMVRIPTVAQEDERRLHRERSRLQKERTQHRVRIQSLMATLGIELKANSDFVEQLEQVKALWGADVPAALKAEVLREYQRLQLVNEQLRLLNGEQRDRLKQPRTKMDQEVAMMTHLRGVGPVGGWIVIKECLGWRDFRNRKQVGGLSGFTGTPYNTGGSEREQGISKAGSRLLRATLIELAWSWLRHQPNSNLTRRFQARTTGGDRRQRRRMIVALARQLLVAFWRYVKQGVVPEGAQLKPAVA